MSEAQDLGTADAWTLAGDETLHVNSDTQNIAGQPVEASRKHLEIDFNGPDRGPSRPRHVDAAG